MGDPFNGYASLVTAAGNGQVHIEMSPENFDKIDKVLGDFIDGIDKLQGVIFTLSGHDDYGLGRHSQATSAPALEKKLKAKVQDGDNCAKDTLVAYMQAAKQLQQMFQASRKLYTGTDNQMAASLFAAVDNQGKA